VKSICADAGQSAGILFTKINLDTFGAVYDEVVSDLAVALDDARTRFALLTPGRHGAESAILQLAVMVVFRLHEADHELDGSQPRYAKAGWVTIPRRW